MFSLLGSVLSARQTRQILAGNDGRVVCSNNSGIGCVTHDTQQQCIIDLSAAFKLGEQVVRNVFLRINSNISLTLREEVTLDLRPATSC